MIYIILTLFLLLETSTYVTMKFTQLSYPQMVQDAVLTAEFVQALPVYISNSLNITADDVIVITITSAPSSAKKKRDTNTSGSGIVVSMAIPADKVTELKNLIENTESALYSTSNGQLATLLDSSYFVSAASTSNVSSQQSMNDPNGSTSNSTNSGTKSNGGLSKGALIGICVSIGVVVYAAATVVFYKVYQRRKRAKEQEALADHQLFAQSISEPIMQDNSFGWTNPHMISQPPHLVSTHPMYDRGNQW